jgi:hypothetical protein
MLTKDFSQKKTALIASRQLYSIIRKHRARAISENAKERAEKPGYIPNSADMDIYTFVNYSTGETFTGTRYQFKKALRIDAQGLKNVMTNRAKSVQGWCLEGTAPDEIGKCVSGKRKKDQTIYTFVHVSGYQFIGARHEFREHIKCSEAALSGLINGKKAHVKKWGLNKAPNSSIFGYAGTKNGNSKKVRCVETGHVFSLIKDAATFVNTRPANISNALRRGTTSGGYHWEYA